MKLTLVAVDHGNAVDKSTRRYWERLIAGFEDANSTLSVDLKLYSRSQVDRKVAQMVRRDDPPNVAQLTSYADYAARGELYRVDEVLSIPTQASYVTSVARAGEIRREQFGMPFSANVRLLFYNKRLLTDAGVLSVPKTWTELKAAAVKLDTFGVKIPYGLPLGAEEAAAETMMWLLSGGGGYTDESGAYTIDSLENVRTLEWLRDDLVGAGLTGPGKPSRTTEQDLFDAFGRGEVGMLSGPPELVKQAEREGIAYGVAPMPGLRGPATSTMGRVDWLMAFRHRHHREHVSAFLDYVYLQQNVVDLAEGLGLLPVTTAASQVMRDDQDHKRLWPFLDAMETASFYPADKSSWPQVSRSLTAQLGPAMQSGGDPAGVLGELQRQGESAENRNR